MASYPKPTKEILCKTKKCSTDQLGNDIGLLQPGDIGKFHIKASYEINRPKFQIGNFQIGKVKPRSTEFLSTHIVGETAFFMVPIPSSAKQPSFPLELVDILSSKECVPTMVLGECSKFTFDCHQMDKETKKLLLCCEQKIHRGHYQSVPIDLMDSILSVTYELDNFRIERIDPKTNIKKEHHRQDRNGRGGAMPGSFNM